MFAFGRTSLDRLADADQRLVKVYTKAMSWQIVDFTIIETHRSRDTHKRYLKEGRSKVSYEVSKHSFHPSKAVDAAPLISGQIPWDDYRVWTRFVGVLESAAAECGVPMLFGIDWDRDWNLADQVFNDGPHGELICIKK